MPITLPPISRRRFIQSTLAAGAALALPAEFTRGAAVADPHRLALLSDVHIAADRTAHERGTVMFDNLEKVRAEVLALETAPSAVFINGDCAYHDGKAEDYQTLLGLLQPIRERGFPLHLSMGNHDNRENIWKNIPDVESHVGELNDRQMMIVECQRANIFMLDSLQKTNFTPGVLGEKQLQWLAGALDARHQKPAIVMVHHQPDESEKPSGLTDTKALLDTLLPRRNVKALFYGHTHHWEVSQREQMHCINLPAVAYVFKNGDPSGWVDAHLTEKGMSLELRCIDHAHPKHGEKFDLAWRA
jgi:predicted phosphodiesterase